MSASVDTLASFTTPEIEAACQMPARMLDLLKREGLVPGQLTPDGRGRQARFGFATLSQMVIVRALAHSFDGYVVPARIAAAVSQEFRDRGQRWIPFGFEVLQREIKGKSGSVVALRDEHGEICPYRTIESAWRSGLVDQERATMSDYALVIVDGELVGEANLAGLPILPVAASNGPMKVAPVLRYRTSGKSAILIETMRSDVDETYFCNRLKNAESVVSLNLGLALRRAVVAIIQQREVV